MLLGHGGQAIGRSGLIRFCCLKSSQQTFGQLTFIILGRDRYVTMILHVGNTRQCDAPDLFVLELRFINETMNSMLQERGGAIGPTFAHLLFDDLMKFVGKLD